MSQPISGWDSEQLEVFPDVWVHQCPQKWYYYFRAECPLQQPRINYISQSNRRPPSRILPPFGLSTLILHTGWSNLASIDLRWSSPMKLPFLWLRNITILMEYHITRQYLCLCGLGVLNSAQTSQEVRPGFWEMQNHHLIMMQLGGVLILPQC